MRRSQTVIRNSVIKSTSVNFVQVMVLTLGYTWLCVAIMANVELQLLVESASALPILGMLSIAAISGVHLPASLVANAITLV